MPPMLPMLRVLVLVALLDPGEAARILGFFPFPAKSHHRLAVPLLKELAARGHHVTAVTPFPLQSPPPNYTQIATVDYLDEVTDIYFNKGKQKQENQEQEEETRLQSLGVWANAMVLSRTALYSQERVARMEQVQRLIASDAQFDAILSTSALFQESAVVLEHRFGAVGIDILPQSSSHWANNIYGNPSNPAFTVDYNVPFTDKMTFFERLGNLVTYLITVVVNHLHYLPRSQAIADWYFRYPGWEGRPGLEEMLANKSLVLLSSHYSLNYPYPIAPHFVEVAGLNVRPSKALPQDIQRFMDEAEDGVILFSFGSIVKVSKTLSKEKRNAFVKAFSQLKQKVIWKWEDEELEGKPDNVLIMKWVPQQDILAHKNCKLFITHGGYASLIESVNHGVPVVGIPLFFDQVKNIKHVVYAGYGLEIGFTNITETSILWAVKETLQNRKYLDAARTRSEIFKERPLTPMESAVYWIEYVIKFKGAPHLRSALTRLKWYQTLMLDVILFCLLSTFITMYIVLLVARFCLKTFCWRNVFLKFHDCKTEKKTL